MTSFAKKAGNVLRNYPLVFRLSSTVYKKYSSFNELIRDYYLRFIEFLLPGKFYIQTIPDILKKNDKEIKKAYKEYNFKQHRSKRDANRIINSKYFLDIVRELHEGDYAELGTYKGIFAKFLYKNMNSNSSLYCFDTFEGFAEQDVRTEKDQVQLSVPVGFFSDTSLEIVRRNILGKIPDKSNLHLIKGYFPESFKGFENYKWRFVLLDADLYEPMKAGVEKFWPQIIKGGILMIHDYYGGYVGTKKAIDEYFKSMNILPVPLCDEAGTAIVIKK